MKPWLVFCLASALAQRITVGNWYDLPTISTLAASGAYGGYRLLSANSEVVLEAALAYAASLYSWQGASDELTTAEIDTIKALIAQAQYELETTQTEGSYEMLRFIQRNWLVNASTSSFTNLSGYKTYFINAQIRNVTASNTYIRLYFNGDTTAANYEWQLHQAYDNTDNNTRNASSSLFGYMTPYEGTLIHGHINLVASSATEFMIAAQMRATRVYSDRLVNMLWDQLYLVPQTAITSIAITADVASCITGNVDLYYLGVET